MKKLLAYSLIALLTACGGGGGSSNSGNNNSGNNPPPQTAPTIHISAPTAPVLQGGPRVQLSAMVSNGATPTWTLAAGAPGKLLPGSDANSILYEPPASGVSATTQIVVTASAGGGSAQYTFNLYPPPGTPGLSLITGAIGQRGFIDGKGTAAAFHTIHSITADDAGGYYVFDVNAEKLAIRKVSANSEVSTLYSTSGSYSYNSDPWYDRGARLALASDGMLYVLEKSANGKRLLRISPNGTANVVLSGAALDKVSGIARAANGAIYLVAPHGLSRLAANGTLAVFAGDPAAAFDSNATPQDGSGAAARFGYIESIGSDGLGNLLLRDGASFRRISEAGVASTVTLAGLADVRDGQIAGGRDGRFYLLASRTPARVYAVMPSNEVSLVFQENGAGPLLPTYIAPGSDGRLLLAQRSELRMAEGATLTRNFAGAQDFSGFTLDGATAEARFSRPGAIAADLAGNLYVADRPGAREPLPGEPGPRGFTMRKISPGGQVTTLFSFADSGTVTGMAVGRNGNIYFSDLQGFGSHGAVSGSAVYKATPDGKVTVLASAGTSSIAVPIRLLGLDAEDNFYFGDSDAKTVIRKVAPDGTITTVSALPAGVGAAPDGNTYVIRSGTVVQVTPDGKEKVVAGTPGSTSTVLTGAGSFYLLAAIAPTGPGSFALVAGEAIIKFVLPH
ncbi:hypothetical protein [Pseudoduganella sp. OTU4001]|uniref:hypothetical protein n=1 Tax=Pseudoduganella sp. OTU4001 TaxID=3043854 RepID=UPI00313CCCB6